MGQLQARNEIIIDAPISKVWELITDINQLHKINPGVISASGSMQQLNGTRTCQIENNGKKGSMTERLIECIPEQKTVWTIESDTMGMGKMLKDTRFCFYLSKVNETQTRLVNESHYKPANFLVSMMNFLMLKNKMSKLQDQILSNVKSLLANDTHGY